ncbi:nuclear transport factor 2 family protein [Arenimonas sp.]|uniref:nuclear transport factor 2 family protein n=1 Tax=Arenimonas sp. TaxID=1872635 RepID=UPI0035B05E76
MNFRRLLATGILLLAPALAQAAAQTPGQAVASLWRALSHEPGEAADLATLRGLFHEDAVVFGSRSRDGKPSLTRRSAAEFLAALAGVDASGFHEREIHRMVEVVDRFATVYSVVESRTDRDAPKADFTGVNSLQLYFDGERWRVLSLYYHVPDDARDIPAPPPAPAPGR